jgi:hypothetical protein
MQKLSVSWMQMTHPNSSSILPLLKKNPHLFGQEYIVQKIERISEIIGEKVP